MFERNPYIMFTLIVPKLINKRYNDPADIICAKFSAILFVTLNLYRAQLIHHDKQLLTNRIKCSN